ncbi:MAG: hypothetical protein ACTSR8_20690 [Promethearchaeota archaeon]
MITIPFYGQLPNCCGLSTFLMLINPPRNEKFKTILDDLYSHLQFLNKQSKKEFQWTIVINYLLLKSLGNNPLTDYLKTRDSDLVKYYMPIMHYELSNEKFSANNIIKRRLFNKYLYTMKTDRDLSILFYLFGGTYHPQQQEISDSTRSLYFSRIDFENKENLIQKINIIRKHMSIKFDVPCIALNVGYHWVAVESIEDNILSIHNPLSRSLQHLKLEKNVPESYRFYLYTYNPKSAFVLKKKIKKFLISGIKEDK